MLFVSIDDFFEKADLCTPLSREEELHYAREMNEGNADAKKKLLHGYLPHVAAHLKRWPARYVSLELIYRCCQSLDKAVSSFDFIQSSEKFSHRLRWFLRQTTVRYLAERK